MLLLEKQKVYYSYLVLMTQYNDLQFEIDVWDHFLKGAFTHLFFLPS